MDSRELLERLYDATARMEAIVCIAGMVTDEESAPGPVADLLDEDVERFTRCFPDAPDWLTKAVDDGRDTTGAFIQWAVETGKLGFALKMATPVMKCHGNSRSYTWGYYYTEWFYGDTLDAAVNNGLAWVEKCREAERAKALKAAKKVARLNQPR